MITVIGLVLALVCFIIAAVSVSLGRVNMIGLGLAIYVLTQLLVALGASA